MIKIRAFDEEKSLWVIKANAEGISLANLIRRMLNSKEVQRKPIPGSARNFTPADPALIRQVAAIGNNLNQIARVVNSTGFTDSFEIIEHLLMIERKLNEVTDAYQVS